jgi:hypothetical protein
MKSVTGGQFLVSSSPLLMSVCFAGFSQNLLVSPDFDLMMNTNLHSLTLLRTWFDEEHEYRFSQLVNRLLSWRNLIKNLRRLESFFVLLCTHKNKQVEIADFSNLLLLETATCLHQTKWMVEIRQDNNTLLTSTFLHNNEFVRNWWQPTLGRASFWSSPCHFSFASELVIEA